MPDDKPKQLISTALTNADLAPQRYNTFFVDIPDDVEYDHIFAPAFWAHHVGGRVKINDLIRCVHVRGTFDIFVAVRSVSAGGMQVEFHSGLPPKGIDPYKVSAKAREEAMRVKPCPIDRTTGQPVVRINHTPRTHWRLIGLNGAEIERDMPTRERAEVRMGLYLDEMRLRLPTDAEIAAFMKGDSAPAATEKAAT